MRFLPLLLATVVVSVTPRLVFARWGHLPSDPNYAGIEFLKPIFTDERTRDYPTN